MPFSATVIVVIKLNSYWLGTQDLLFSCYLYKHSQGILGNHHIWQPITHRGQRGKAREEINHPIAVRGVFLLKVSWSH